MLTVNLDIQDRLINDQTGNLSCTEFAQFVVRKVYIKFPDEKARGRSRAASTSKMKCFGIIVNGWKLLTIITKCSILDDAPS